jgi:hypothetical protein
MTSPLMSLSAHGPFSNVRSNACPRRRRTMLYNAYTPRALSLLPAPETPSPHTNHQNPSPPPPVILQSASHSRQCPLPNTIDFG